MKISERNHRSGENLLFASLNIGFVSDLIRPPCQRDSGTTLSRVQRLVPACHAKAKEMPAFRPLAKGFPQATEAEWRVLAERGNAGGLGRLTSASIDGLPIGLIDEVGSGPVLAMHPGDPWTIIQRIDRGDAAANSGGHRRRPSRWRERHRSGLFIQPCDAWPRHRSRLRPDRNRLRIACNSAPGRRVRRHPAWR